MLASRVAAEAVKVLPERPVLIGQPHFHIPVGPEQVTSAPHSAQCLPRQILSQQGHLSANRR